MKNSFENGIVSNIIFNSDWGKDKFLRIVSTLFEKLSLEGCENLLIIIKLGQLNYKDKETSFGFIQVLKIYSVALDKYRDRENIKRELISLTNLYIKKYIDKVPVLDRIRVLIQSKIN